MQWRSIVVCYRRWAGKLTGLLTKSGNQTSCQWTMCVCVSVCCFFFLSTRYSVAQLPSWWNGKHWNWMALLLPSSSHTHTHTWYSRTPWRDLAIKSTHQTCFAYLCTNSTVRIYLAFTLNLSLFCSFTWPFVRFLGNCVNPICKFCDDKRPT